MEIIKLRLNELIKNGNDILSNLNLKENKSNYYFEKSHTKNIQSWMISSANLISNIPHNNTYLKEYEKIRNDEHINELIPIHVVQKLTGLLESLKNEIESGLLKNLEYVFIADTFDDFLKHAENFHKSNNKKEAAILASIVFEDTIRKIAEKNNIKQEGINLDKLIDSFSKQNIFTNIKAKKAKTFATIRNKALHTQWSEFDIRDVGDLIKGTKEIIENYL